MKNAVIIVTRPGLGTTSRDDADFGIEMLDKFFHTLESRPAKPRAIVFYTEGVKAVVEGSTLILGLKLLQGLGVRIVVCQTCLQRYGLEDRVAVGEAGGMTEIVQLLDEADQVITV